MEDVFGLVGATLRDQYRVDGVAGEGGFGVVYRAHHLGFDQPVAVKCLKLPTDVPAAVREAMLTSFQAEARTLFKLSQHPAIVRVLETGLAPGRVPFLVMEWLEGRDVDELLAARMAEGLGPYGEREAVELLRPAIEAIGFAHAQGYAHRDIKPANLFVSRGPFGTVVKVLDFGVAKVMADGDTATRAFTQGDPKTRPFSPTHGAPEQVSAARFGPTGPWTDVHALALVLVELTSGRHALLGDNVFALIAATMDEHRPTPRARGAKVSDAFERVCRQALSLVAKERYPDARALLAALDEALRPATKPRSPGLLPPTEHLPPGYAPPDAPVPPRIDALARTIADTRPSEPGTVVIGLDELEEVPSEPPPSDPRLPRTRESLGPLDLRELVGSEVAGFRLLEHIGEGATAVVFRAENVVSPSIVRAIKIVRPELGSRPDLARRFAEEAVTLERLDDPHIVRFFGLRTHDRGAVRLLVMELELLRGAPLSRLGRAAPVSQAVQWMAMAARGVAAAHRIGVVHWDLKPDNLFLTMERVLKVLDFGIARVVDEADRASRLTKEGATPGTPAYMAPEVVQGRVPDARADVYALGITLLELLLGRHPFALPGGEPRSSAQLMYAHLHESLPRASAERTDVPPALEAVVVRATARDPAARYRDAGELAAALAAVDLRAPAPQPALKRTERLPPPGRVVGPTEVMADEASPEARRERPRWFLPALAGSAAFVVILGGFGLASLGGDGDEADARVEARPASDPEPAATTTDDQVMQPVAEQPLNRWVRVDPPQEPQWLGVGFAPPTVMGFRREVETPRDPFFIQAHEVTWAELEPYLRDTGRRVERPPWVPSTPTARARWAASGVPWSVAHYYCRSLGGDLPTEAQWEYAARGPSLYDAPWGNAPIDRERTRVLREGGHPAEVEQSWQDRTQTGIADLIGNAREWTRDQWREDRPGQDETWVTADGADYRAVRGLHPNLPSGTSPIPQAEAAAYRMTLDANDTDDRVYLPHVGFRCVRSGSE